MHGFCMRFRWNPIKHVSKPNWLSNTWIWIGRDWGSLDMLRYLFSDCKELLGFLPSIVLWIAHLIFRQNWPNVSQSTWTYFLRVHSSQHRTMATSSHRTNHSFITIPSYLEEIWCKSMKHGGEDGKMLTMTLVE